MMSQSNQTLHPIQTPELEIHSQDVSDEDVNRDTERFIAAAAALIATTCTTCTMPATALKAA